MFVLFSLLPLVALAQDELIPIARPDNTSAVVEFPIVRRGRQVYYQCNIGSYSVLSTTPCNTLQKCASNDNNIKLGVGCSNAVQCTPYFQGPVKCVSNCCCTAVTGTQPNPPSTGNSGVCYHGQLSQVGCSSRGQCSSGQTCMNGLCCTTTRNELTAACGGLAAVGSCNAGGSCSGNMYCTPSNYCCECPVGRTAGKCTNGACAAGFKCMPNGYCCASCPNNAMPFGACRDGVCGAGKTCRAGNICC